MPWPCYLVTKTTRAFRHLRRYHDVMDAAAKCPAGNYHNAHTYLDEIDFPACDYWGTGADNFTHDDPHWPKQCVCGYVFTDKDQWQCNTDMIWEGNVSGKLIRGVTGFTVTPDHKLPPGAIFLLNQDEGLSMFRPPVLGPDGKVLSILLPGGTLWQPRDPAWKTENGKLIEGNPWTVVGTPPNITCSPSINCGNYHGYVRDGEVIEDSEGRKFDAYGNSIK